MSTMRLGDSLIVSAIGIGPLRPGSWKEPVPPHAFSPLPTLCISLKLFEGRYKSVTKSLTKRHDSLGAHFRWGVGMWELDAFHSSSAIDRY